MERLFLPSKYVYYNYWRVKSSISHHLDILYSKRGLMKLNNNELYSLNNNILLFINMMCFPMVDISESRLDIDHYRFDIIKINKKYFILNSEIIKLKILRHKMHCR